MGRSNCKKAQRKKGLKSQNLKDHMSEAKLIFTALAEFSTRQIAETDEAKGLKNLCPPYVTCCHRILMQIIHSR